MSWCFSLILEYIRGKLQWFGTLVGTVSCAYACVYGHFTTHILHNCILSLLLNTQNNKL
uniref:Uncharacterized protein n=1 Tax=Anguilla anguilla TaxID=7936 RepID=A0A0E9TIH9_ANGAN